MASSVYAKNVPSKLDWEMTLTIEIMRSAEAKNE